MELANHAILVAGILFLLSILATALTPRLGVPLLLIFLLVGLGAGEDGPGGIAFNDYRLANLAGTAALAVILFDGGLRTRIEDFRVGLRPALALATIGVLATTGIVGVTAAHLFKLSLPEGLLIGAIVGSTDAAAVFSLLHTSAVHLNQRITSALEIESGTNDPMAVFLTLGLIEYLQAPTTYEFGDLLLFLLQQMGLGVAIGMAGGRLLTWVINRIDIGDSLYPLLTLFGGLLIFGITGTLGGSGFLAVYLAGLILGNRNLRAFASIRRFHDGIAWLAQIGMFIILGLLATPTRVKGVAIPALFTAAVLILVARPIAVALALAPFRFPWREKTYLAWVGLRGSVPMVLATYPLIAGLKHAQLFFDVAFFIVLVSLIVQGWTVAPVARLLGLQMPRTSARILRTDVDLPGTQGFEIVSYRVSNSSALIGRKPKTLPLADVSRIVSVTRNGRLLPYKEWGGLQAGDYVSLLAAKTELPTLDAVFQTKKPDQATDRKRYFGEFALDPAARVDDLVAAYNFEVPSEAGRMTLATFVSTFLNKPVVGDRLRLGDAELVVKKMDGIKIVELGLRLPHE
jgi:cell volume regulation protein A